MLIPSYLGGEVTALASLSRRVNANSQPGAVISLLHAKLIKKGEC